MSKRIQCGILSAVVLLGLVYIFGVPRQGLTQEPVLQLAPTRPAPAGLRGPGTGFVPPPLDLSHLSGQRMPEKFLPQALPSSWDWRAQGKVTSVRDQGACGSCYAFAAIANMESKLMIAGAGTHDFSENNAKECNWWETAGTGVGSCDGGNYHMMASLFSKKGTVLESCDPYVASDATCKTTCSYQKTLLGWRIISGSSIPDPGVLKSYIQNYGPVYTSMYAGYYDAWHSELSAYDGSYTLYYAGTEDPNHAVLIVGWDDGLVHAGGTGGWIVKNSWGTSWGDSGYFTIAYGSASIGGYSSFMYDWQDYDASGDVLYYDEGGNSNAWGCTGSTTAWGLVKYIPSSNTQVTRVEFWTSDATTDVDVYLYDSFNGTAPSGLLADEPNNTFDEAGYHSVPLDAPLPITSGNDIIAVVKFTNDSYTFPIAADDSGPDESGRTFISCDGSSGSWTDLGVFDDDDVAIRLRTSPAPNVGLDKAVVGSDFEPGDHITFTLSIANSGDAVAANVVVTDIVPTEVLTLTFGSTLAITPTGVVSYVWDVEPLGMGDGGVITIYGRTDPGLASDFSFANTATISDPEDSTPANNTGVVIVNGYVVYLPLVMKN